MFLKEFEGFFGATSAIKVSIDFSISCTSFKILGCATINLYTCSFSFSENEYRRVTLEIQNLLHLKNSNLRSAIKSYLPQMTQGSIDVESSFPA